MIISRMEFTRTQEAYTEKMFPVMEYVTTKPGDNVKDIKDICDQFFDALRTNSKTWFHEAKFKEFIKTYIQINFLNNENSLKEFLRRNFYSLSIEDGFFDDIKNYLQDIVDDDDLDRNLLRIFKGVYSEILDAYYVDKSDLYKYLVKNKYGMDMYLNLALKKYFERTVASRFQKFKRMKDTITFQDKYNRTVRTYKVEPITPIIPNA